MDGIYSSKDRRLKRRIIKKCLTLTKYHKFFHDSLCIVLSYFFLKWFTWLAEAPVAMSLINANAMDARRRVAAGKLFLAVKTDVAAGAAAVRPAVVCDHTTAPVVAH